MASNPRNPVLGIEARMVDHASRVLNEIDQNAAKTAQSGIASFRAFAQGIGGTIIVLNQFGQLIRQVVAFFRTLAAAFLDPIKRASEAEVAQVKLIGALRATGFAIGVTARQLFDYAKHVSSATGVSREMVLEAQAILLTFKKVGEDVFPRVISATVDMVRLLGAELKGSVIQLGKALQDPIAGVSALAEVGITFTLSQREVITSLVQSGRTLEAQKLILAEVEGQLKGVAELLGQTFLIRAEKAKNAWTSFKAAIGDFIVQSPYAKAALAAVTEILEEWEDILRNADGPLGDLKGKVDDFVQRAAPWFVRAVGGMVDVLFEAAEGTVYLIGWFRQLRAEISEFGGQRLLERFGRGITKAWNSIVEEVQNFDLFAELSGKNRDILEFIKSDYPEQIERYWTSLRGNIQKENDSTIEGIRKARDEVSRVVESLAKEIEDMVATGGLVDRLLSEDEARDRMASFQDWFRGSMRKLADSGLIFARPFSFAPGELAAAENQRKEFESRLSKIQQTELDVQINQAKEYWNQIRLMQREALEAGTVDAEHFSTLMAAIDDQQAKDIAELRKKAADELAKTENDKAKKIKETQDRIEEIIQASLDFQAVARQGDLDKALLAEKRRFEQASKTAMALTDVEKEQFRIRETLLSEHQIRNQLLRDSHAKKLAEDAEKERKKTEQEAAELAQMARDRMEFQRDLELQLEVFQTEGAERRLAELNRAFEAEKRAFRERSEALKLEAGEAEQYLRALSLEHAKAVRAITGTTMQGIRASIEENRNLRETEFEAAKNDTSEIIQSGRDNFTTMFQDIATGTVKAKDAFKAMAASILTDIARIMAARAAANVLASIGFADGGIMPGRRVGSRSLDFRAFASGGIARRPTMAVFAEVPGTAEAFVPLPDGNRIPVTLDIRGLAREATSPTPPPQQEVNVNFTVNAIDAASFQGLLASHGQVIVDLVKEALRSQPDTRNSVQKAVQPNSLGF